MATFKTKPWNFVYTDDLKLGVKIEENDVPFEGVKAFRISRYTQNYIGDYGWYFDKNNEIFYGSALASGKTWNDVWDENKHAYKGGHNIIIYRIYGIVDLGSSYSAGTPVTISWKQQGYLWYFALWHSNDGSNYSLWNKDSETIYVYGDASLGYWENVYGLHLSIDGTYTETHGHPEKLFKRWYNVYITYILPTTTRYIKFTWDFYNAYNADNGNGVIGYIREPQLTLTPFPVAFRGSEKLPGIVRIPKGVIPDNGVLSFWYKINLADYSLSDAYYYVLTSYPDHTWETDGALYLQLPKGYSYLQLVYKAEDSSGNLNDYRFSIPNSFNEWNFMTIIFSKSSGFIKLYQNGEYVNTISGVYKGLTASNWITFGANEDNWGTHDIMFSNILIAKYDPNIWTDDYIQTLYNLKKPFIVPPKMSVV